MAEITKFYSEQNGSIKKDIFYSTFWYVLYRVEKVKQNNSMHNFHESRCIWCKNERSAVTMHENI